MHKTTPLPFARSAPPIPPPPLSEGPDTPIESRAAKNADVNPNKKKPTNYIQLGAQILGIFTSFFLIVASILMMKESKWSALIILVIAFIIFVMESGEYFDTIFKSKYMACFNLNCTGSFVKISAKIAGACWTLKSLVHALTAFLVIYCGTDGDGPTEYRSYNDYYYRNRSQYSRRKQYAARGHKESNQWYLAIPSILCCIFYFYLGWAGLQTWFRKNCFQCGCFRNSVQ